MAQKVLNTELYEEILVRPSPGSPPIPVDIGQNVSVVMGAEVEVKNDIGNPVPTTPNITRGSGPIDANTQRITLATDGPTVAALTSIDADLGALADNAASSDTGAFSLIALVKRGLQNWTTLLTRIPTLTLSGSRLQVDGSGVTQPVSGTVATTVAVRSPTTTSVASSASSVTILAANANRRGCSIANDSTATLRLSFSTPATTANAFLVLPPGAFILLDQQMIVTGIIYGIWSAANGTAQVTEYV